MSTSPPPAKKRRTNRRLYEELEKYSSLLNVIRTEELQGTLSSSHRVHPAVKASGVTNLEYIPTRTFFPTAPNSSAIDQDGSQLQIPNAGPSYQQLNEPRSLRRSSTVLTNRKSGRQARNHPGRWPSLLSDTVHPYFSLEDEVDTLADQSRASINANSKRQSRSQSSETSPRSLTSQEEDSLNPHESQSSPSHLLQSLTTQIASLLDDTFTLLAAHRPSVAPSMQIRLAPMNWSSVLNILAANQVVNPSVIDKVRARMTTIPALNPSLMSERTHQVDNIEDGDGVQIPLVTHRTTLLSTHRSKLAAFEAALLKEDGAKYIPSHFSTRTTVPLSVERSALHGDVALRILVEQSYKPAVTKRTRRKRSNAKIKNSDLVNNAASEDGEKRGT